MREKLTKIKTLLKENKTVRGVCLAVGLLVLALLVAAVLYFVFWSQDNQPEDKSTRVAAIAITANGFQPESIIVEKGTRVIWTNSDEKIHQVAANPHPTSEDLPSLVSEILNNDQVYEYTFDESGTFGYHDKLNPTINGVIEVKK
jgi:plastocyanin